MKKFLSLVLALAMTMSLVTISAGAKDFTDADDITYVEAVEVMTAIGVVDGDTAGNFNPTNGLTRGAAAKIICNLILGPTTAAELNADTAPYKDVAKNSTFAGYIAYCQKAGIISGYADGTFKPAAPLTGYAFMKMLLGALGYDGEVEGYTGANWSINVAKQAIGIGLNDGLVEDFNGSDFVTREEAMLYAFNTLQATMVEYDARTEVAVGGANVVIAGSSAKEVAQGSYKNTMNEAYLQFAEKYFGKLTLTEGTDEFARPATTWRYKGDKVGTYADTADLTYSDNVKLGDIYADLGMTEKDSVVEVYVNGVQKDNVAVAKNNTLKIAVDDSQNNGLVGVGSTVEVFYDADNNDVTIVVIDTYVGTIQKTVAATSAKDAYIVIDETDNVYPANWNDEYETDEVFEDDAVVLYTFSQKEKSIQSVELAESVTGTLNKIVSTKKLTLGDTVYNYAIKHDFETTISNEGGLKTGSEYTFYTDSYGNVIYVEEEEYISSDYAMIVAIESSNSASSAFTSNRVKLLTAEGVEAVYSTDKNYVDSTYHYEAGNIVTYKVKDNGTVALKKVSGTAVNYLNKNASNGSIQWNDSKKNNYGFVSFDLNSGEAKITVYDGEYVHANSKTVFVIRDKDGEYTVYTGIKNVPSIQGTTSSDKIGVAYYCKTSGLATVMFIDAARASVVSSSDDVIYLAGKSVSKKTTDLDNTYYTFNAVVKGELKEITVEANSSTVADGVFTVSNDVYTATKANLVFGGASYNSDGIITSFTSVGGAVSKGTASGTTKMSGEYTIKLSGTPYTVDEDANIWTVDDDGVITAATLKDIKTDASNTVVYTQEDGQLTNLFVQLPASTNDVDAGTTPGYTGVTAVQLTTDDNTLGVTLINSTQGNSYDVSVSMIIGGTTQALGTYTVTVDVDGWAQLPVSTSTGVSYVVSHGTIVCSITA